MQANSAILAGRLPLDVGAGVCYPRSVRALAVLALLVLAGCQPASPVAQAEQEAIRAFRATYAGSGRREPWTTRVTISPTGDWVVREFALVAARARPEPLTAADRQVGIDWRATVLVTYWSRVVEAAAWRGPELPSSWDQYAVRYRAERRDSRLSLEPLEPTNPV